MYVDLCQLDVSNSVIVPLLLEAVQRQTIQTKAFGLDLHEDRRIDYLASQTWTAILPPPCVEEFYHSGKQPTTYQNSRGGAVLNRTRDLVFHRQMAADAVSVK